MSLLSKFLRFAVLTALVALAAPSADAGLRDALGNARDTVKCASTAVFRSLETIARGFKIGEPGGMSQREYGREANKSTKEAMKECLAASENIMARSFGVEKVAAKARKVAAKARKWAASAKSAADEVSKWFDGKKMPQEDGRMALSVGDDEREFYKRETGVLGDEPLPAAKPSPLDEDIQRLFEEKRRLDEQEAAWEAGTADDPWADNRNSTWDDPWSAGAPSEPGTHGPDAAGSDRNDWARDEARSEDVEQPGPGYGAAEDHDSYSKALEEMERREIAEARRKLELDAEHRRQAVSYSKAFEEMEGREIAEARRILELDAEHRRQEAERSEMEGREIAEARRKLELDAEHRRQAAERQRRRSKALWERNLKMAKLQQELNSALSECSNLQRRDGLCWRNPRGGGTCDQLRQQNIQREASARNRCRNRAQSTYQSSLRFLLLSVP